MAHQLDVAQGAPFEYTAGLVQGAQNAATGAEEIAAGALHLTHDEDLDGAQSAEGDVDPALAIPDRRVGRSEKAGDFVTQLAQPDPADRKRAEAGVCPDLS